MKKIILLFLFISTPVIAQQNDISGNWKGFLEAASRKMDIIVSFKKESKQWSGTLSSETQQLKDLEINNIKLMGEQLSFDVPLAGGRWQGKLINADSLTGNWIQAGFQAPLNFKKLSKKPTLKIKERDQTPEAPFPYLVREVSYLNERDGTKLAATLTLPKGKGPFPAAILLTVAGANDRDQTHSSPRHKPYLVLADHLTKNGIAVLRADDRGVGGSSGNLFNSTIEDFAYDALAGFNFLKSNSAIDQNQIGFIGNSEGTLVAPLAASINNEAAFIVTLGGIGVTGAQVILDQIDALGALSHFDKNTIEQLKSRTNSLFDIIRTEKDSIKVAGSIEQLLNDGNSPDVDSSLFLLPKSIDEQVRIFSSSWYKFQVLYDPAKVLRQTRIPFLALHGDLDPYVLCDKNLRAIGDHLRQADNRQFALIKLKGVNHIMQDASTGSPTDYTSNESSFSTRALELILSWLKVSLTFPD